MSEPRLVSLLLAVNSRWYLPVRCNLGTAQACQLSLERACAVHATCWLQNTKLVQTLKVL